MKRLPVFPTLIVALAVAAMIGLGFWQLRRAEWKAGLLAAYAAAAGKPAMAFPRFPDDALLFRRAAGTCLQPVSMTTLGAGRAGFRVIAECRTGAEGPGMTVQLGTARDPAAHVVWRGGRVSGFISHAPDNRSMIETLFDHRPQRLMLVLDPPAAGLAPNPPADISAIPNNHVAYAVQWFAFAAIAAIIYALALRKRRAGLGTPETRR